MVLSIALALADDDGVAASWRWRRHPGEPEKPAKEEEEEGPVFHRGAWRFANAMTGLLTGAVGLGGFGIGSLSIVDSWFGGGADDYAVGAELANRGAGTYFAGMAFAAVSGLAGAAIVRDSGHSAPQGAGLMSLAGSAIGARAYALLATGTVEYGTDLSGPLLASVVIGGGMAGAGSMLQWRHTVAAGRAVSPRLYVVPLEDGASVRVAARF